MKLHLVIAGGHEKIVDALMTQGCAHIKDTAVRKSVHLYIYKGRVCVTMYVTSSLPNGSSDGKTDYTTAFVMVQGWFLS